MTRRRLVAITSAGVLLLLGLAVFGVFVSLTQTDRGRGYLQRNLNVVLRTALKGHGRLYIGRISGNLVTDITIDTVALYDEQDSLFVSSGRIRASYDPRDLLDKRLLFDHVDVQHPFVNLRRRPDHQWNYQHIFPKNPSAAGSGTPKTSGIPHPTQRGFGDHIVLRHATVHDGLLIVTEPWSPPDTLRGAKADSATGAAIASSDHDIRRTSEGVKKSLRWSELQAGLSYVRISDPDSVGRLILIDRLQVNMHDPPFLLRHVRGPLQIVGDTAIFDIAHFDLPGSTGRLKGRIFWPQGPLRFDFHVWGDSVSLADVNWVYRTLPKVGGGSMELQVRNNARDPRIMEYALSRMDIRTTASRLRGEMTFGVGAPVLLVKNVDVQVTPVDFDFFRTLNGGPFPVDWQGAITGQVRARGGPLNRFVVDQAQLELKDKHVAGATTRLNAVGMVDILSPALTKFRGLRVDLGTLDLRTIEYLFPSFPRLHGTVSGAATLDSVWQDVRFGDASIYHHDGDAPLTHLTGNGRVTVGDQFTGFDVTLMADPLSFTALARSYQGLPVRGEFSGPLRVKGTTPDLAVNGRLTGSPGTMSVDGRFDLFGPIYSARGTGAVERLDVSALLDRPSLPATRLTGTVDADVRGDSLRHLEGTLAINGDRSSVHRLELLPSAAWLHFGGGKMSVDSLELTTTTAQLTASGALGLTPTVSDSLHYRIRLDSLGGLRPFFAAVPPSPVTQLASTSPAVPDVATDDSEPEPWRGFLTATGALVGSIDLLGTHGTLRGGDFVLGSSVARRLNGQYEFADVLGSMHGQASVTLDSVMASGVRLAGVTAHLAASGVTTGRAHLELRSEGAAWQQFTGQAALAYTRAADTLRLTLDTLNLRVVDRHWALSSPATVLMDSIGTTVPSLALRDGVGGSIALQATLPDHRPVHATVRADSVPLGDLGILAQLSQPLDGLVHGTIDVRGTRAAPEMQYESRVDGMRYGDVHVPFFTVRGGYAAHNMNGTLLLFRNAQPVLTVTAALPVDLALEARVHRLLGDTLAVRARADSVDLALVEAISPMFSRVTGQAMADLRVGGTFQRPRLTGQFAIHEGEMGLPRMGIRLQRLNADIAFTRDSILVRRFSARSGAHATDTLALTGALSVPSYTTIARTGFDLNVSARTFQAFDRKTLSRVEVSGVARLSGTYEHSSLSGTVQVDRGTLYLPELARKEIVSLDDPDFSQVVDTTFGRNSGILLGDSPLVRDFLQHLEVPGLSISVGQDVWLRSSEANIKLGGAVDLKYNGEVNDTLLLTGHQGHTRWTGTLQVVRGTYRLDLGVVQRTFQVDSGRVTFYGDPDIPEELTIWATYTVRRVDQPDIRILAHIGGSLQQPKLDLQSDQLYALSYSEILSYLVFGQPTFTLGTDAAAALAPVASALLPTIGGVLERALADQVGIFDLVQLQTGGVASYGPAGSSQQLISGSRIGLGKQLGERTFVTANAGLCRLVSTNQAGNSSFVDALGLTVEHRLGYGLTLQASSEPSSTALACGRLDTRNTPRQYGFDLFRDWTF